MTKLLLAIALLTALSSSRADAQNAAVPVPNGSFLVEGAQWRQDLSFAEIDHAKGQCNFLIMSDITKAVGSDSTNREGYNLLIKVTAWGRPFAGTDMPAKPDPKTASGHLFTVILNQTDDPKEIRAEYEDTIYEKGKVKLKFSGITLLHNDWVEPGLRELPPPQKPDPQAK